MASPKLLGRAQALMKHVGTGSGFGACCRNADGD
jgi:hypothetical protein